MSRRIDENPGRFADLLCRSWPAGLLLCVLCAGTAQAGPAASQKDLPQLNDELRQCESQIKGLHGEFANPVAQTLLYSAEKRMMDGRVYLELGLYPQAAALFLDVVENPRFRAYVDMPEARYLLARSLYLDRNYLAARRYFEKMINPPDPKFYQDAIGGLVEIALMQRQHGLLARYFSMLQAIPAGARKPEMQYVMGKAHYELGDVAKAEAALRVVPADSLAYPRARYYIGVIQTARKQFAAAIETFESISVEKMPELEANALVDLVNMSLGRLYNETGQTLMAIDRYQQIERESPFFDRSLFEIAWCYLNAQQYDKALNALQILMLQTTDEHLSVEASELQGRLAIYLRDYDEAMEVYQGIVERFARVRNELNEVFGKQENVASYFQWLILRGRQSLGLNGPLSERVADWVESSEEMRHVVTVLGDVTQTRNDIEDGLGIARRVRQAVRAANRIELFANLREGWIKAVELENRLLDLHNHVLDHQYGQVPAQVSADERTLLETIHQRREVLAKRFLRLPQTAAAIVEQQSEVRRNLQTLRRDHFVSETSLKQLASRLQALDRYVRNSLYGEEKDPDLGGREPEYLKKIEEEKKYLQTVFDRVESVNGLIDDANAAIGAGDMTSRDDSALKSQLLAAQRDEQQWYQKNVSKAGADFDTWHQRFWAAVGLLRQAALLIDKTADQKADEVEAMVMQNERTLLDARLRAERNEALAMAVSREVGAPLVENIRKRLATAVLDADVGLLDLTWQRKQGKATQIREMNMEREARLRDLQHAYEATKGGTQAAAVTKQALTRALPPPASSAPAAPSTDSGAPPAESSPPTNRMPGDEGGS